METRSRVRIFVTTSHISSVYMTLFARATCEPGDRDVLLVDIGTRRKDVVAFIRETARSHNWALVESFSVEVDEAHSFEPSKRKRLTRKWKELPLVRSIYALILKRFERSRDESLIFRIRQVLAPAMEDNSKLEVFGHTQTTLDKLITRIYAPIKQAFFEHGLGDYHYIEQQGRLLGPLFVLFAEGFTHFLKKRGIASDEVRSLTVAADFRQLAKEQMVALLSSSTTRSIVPVDKSLVLILLEAVDMYEVSEAFWSAYIDHILSAIEEPDQYHFLLKPHPVSSASSLRITETHCRRIGLSFSMLQEPWQKSVSAEVMFAQWSDRTAHVFCLFSSACFYLSQLYPDPRIKYHYSTDFMDKWTGNAPPMYKRHFEALKPLISEVFAERCVPY